MGATPTAGLAGGNGGTLMPRRKEAPDSADRRETPAWGYLVRPSLLPTVFAPSGNAPGEDLEKKMAARRV